jgi:ubiquitin C-terminal hydrolase
MHSYNTSNSAYGSYIRGKTPIKYPSTSISSISGISNIRQVYNYPKGLINLKNTCYISSVLQILF